MESKGPPQPVPAPSSQSRLPLITKVWSDSAASVEEVLNLCAAWRDEVAIRRTPA